MNVNDAVDVADTTDAVEVADIASINDKNIETQSISENNKNFGTLLFTLLMSFIKNYWGLILFIIIIWLLYTFVLSKFINFTNDMLNLFNNIGLPMLDQINSIAKSNIINTNQFDAALNNAKTISGTTTNNNSNGSNPSNESKPSNRSNPSNGSNPSNRSNPSNGSNPSNNINRINSLTKTTNTNTNKNIPDHSLEAIMVARRNLNNRNINNNHDNDDNDDNDNDDNEDNINTSFNIDDINLDKFTKSNNNHLRGNDGYCFIGKNSNDVRVCSRVYKNNKCMSGDIFPSLRICMDPTLRE